MRRVIVLFARRSFAFWFGLRLMLLFLMLLSGATLASAVALPVRVSIGIALLVGAVSVLDVHRRGERLLWANLGVSWMPIPLVSAATALVCEALLAATL